MEIYYGVVVNNNDPAKIGRVQIKICGEHDQTSDIETLPWAEVMQSASNGLIGGVGFSSVLKNGTWVYVIKLENTETRYLVLGVCTGVCGEEQVEGFNDPNNKYPLEGTKGLSDFGHCSINEESLPNRAYNDTTKTSKGVDFQYENTVTPNKYLDTSVYRSSSGMMVEIDDSEEKLKITHPSGSTIQISSDGTITLTSLNNFVLNCKGDTTFNIKGNYNLNIDGNSNIDIKGNSEIGIQGNESCSINGYKEYQVKGNISCVANSDIGWKVDNDIKWSVNSDVKFDIGSDMNVTSSDGLIKGPNVITKQGVNLDKHVHSGVDRGRSNTDRAEDSV